MTTIDAIGTDYSDVDEPESLYQHVPSHAVTDIDGRIRLIATLCGQLIHESRVIWYDGLSSVNCPNCLRIVAIGKSARIGKKRLPKVVPVEP